MDKAKSSNGFMVEVSRSLNKDAIFFNTQKGKWEDVEKIANGLSQDNFRDKLSNYDCYNDRGDNIMPQIVGLIESIIKATESDVLRNTAWIIDTYKLSEEDAEKEAKAICAGSQTIAGLRKKMAGKNVAIAYFRDGERLNKNTLDILALAESPKAMKFLDDVTIAVADGNDEIIGEEVPLPEFCSRLGLNFKKTGRYGSSYDASDDASGGGECEDPDDEGDCDSINTPPHIFNRFVGGSKVHYALCHVTRGDDGKEEKLVITTKTEADAKLVSGQQEPVDHFGYYEVDRCGYGSNYVPTIPWRKIGEYVREKKKGEKK